MRHRLSAPRTVEGVGALHGRGPVRPRAQAGPLAARQFFLTFSASVINHFTYGEALAPAYGTDPLSPDGIAERRAHLHWLVDALLAALERG